MSNNVKLQVLLRAVDQASRPFKSIRTASKSLSGDIRETQKSLRELNGHASRIEGFRKTSAQLAVTGHALEKARQEAEALATQFKNTERPTRAQAKVLESAKRAAEDLQAKYNRLIDSVKRQQRELAAVGINTRNLAHDEQGLKNRISETTAQLNRQRDALARVSAQQAKLNAVKQRYQAGKELAGNMASVGAAGVGIAAAGTMAGVKLLMPGYEFAQKNSELQAVLGVAKDSAEMTALRKQARQLGDNTAASADDAAGAQIIIAKAGGDVDAIQAATPVTLNMALANRRTMEENAALLMGMKSAFQLSNDKVAHIGDVLSMTMNKTAADFDGMSDALTYAAPVAKNAGVSIEETAAMVGALHDAKITGWTMVGYPDSDTIVSNNTTFLANYNTNIVEKYVYSYSPDVGSKCLYKKTSFVKKGQKIELPTVIPGVKNVKWIKTEELDELIKNGYIINTDTGSYYFEADAEIDDSVPPTDDNNGSTGGNNNQTTTDGNKGNNEGTKLSSDKIQEAVASITTAKAGDTYTVDMSEATVVPKDVLEAAKGKDVDIVLDMNGYKWTINGNNIQADNLKDINLAVDTDSDAIPDDVISELAGNNPVKQISLAYSGDFGFKASLTYNIGSEYAGKYGNLYYYDSTGRMIFQNAGTIDADGNISLNFSHASEYAVVIADNDVTTDNNVTTDNDVTTDNADNTATSSIATGDSSPIVLYAVLCVMAIALAGIAVVTRKKNA